MSLFLCGNLAVIKYKVCRHSHIHKQSSTPSFCYPVTHTPFSLNTRNSHWDFTLLNNIASLYLSKSISILRAGFLFLNFHVRNMRWWMENEMMRNMFPYWFDCRYDGINHVLALADRSRSPHKNYIQFNLVFCIFIKKHKVQVWDFVPFSMK